MSQLSQFFLPFSPDRPSLFGAAKAISPVFLALRAAGMCSLMLAAGALPLQAVPVISEFLADNDGGLKDEDGEDGDWIEIHNPDPNIVNLAGWSLTDDVLRPGKWVFPAYNLQPGARLVVWASGKDRDVGQFHTDFQLDPDGDYLALISPTGVASTQFAPFPFQTKNTSYGTGYSGAVAITDGTPTVLIGGTHYSRIKLSGVGTAVQDNNSLNLFDDRNALPEHQQYLWFDYSSRLASIPAGQNVVDATMEWVGKNQVFAGASGLNTITTPVGVFLQPDDGNRGITAIGTGADGKDLIDFFAATPPYASITIEQGVNKTFVWNVTQLVKDWLAAPNAGNYGKFLLVPGAHPSWIGWDQNRPGPKLTIRTQASATPVTALGFMTPSPAALNSGVTPAGPLLRLLTENPPQPPPAADFPVTAHIVPLQGGAVTSVSLTYRKHYEVEATVTMLDDGTSGDATAGDKIYTGLIPSAQMIAGQMIRWRVTATDTAGYQTKMPPYRIVLDSPQYFGTVTANATITTPLLTLHRFVQTPTAANSTAGTRCAVFLHGEFYDNVGINLHGQSTSGGDFLKKSYDIDGNRGYRFKWSMDPNQPRAKDINLLTIFADKTKLRHELAYEMEREAGVAAHYCIAAHCRLNGNFDGIYNFTEDGDDVYLERAGLNKDGVLYKMYNNMLTPASDATSGAEKKSRKFENNSDLFKFLVGMNLTDNNARKAFLFDNLDTPKMINFMAANTVTGNVDLHAKNYYVYSDTGRTNLWTLLPWDMDLSQGRLWTGTNNYFDDGMYLNAGGTLSGQGQGLVSKLYAIPEFSNMAKRRIRVLQDKFFKGTAVPVVTRDLTRWYDRRINESATLMGASWTVGQNDTPGADAALDFLKYPAAQWKNPNGSVSPFAKNTMSLEIQRQMDTYVVQRINTINSDTSVPPAYNLNTLIPLNFSAVEHSPASGDQDHEYITLTNPNTVSLDLSGWQITGGVTFTFEPGSIINGTSTTGANGNKIFIASSRNAFKTRTVSPKGGESLNVTGGFKGHLTNLGETLNLLDDKGVQRATITYAGSATPHQQWLAITEVMYNPGGNGQAEFVEVTNLSTSVTLEMAGVHFTAGFDFSFTGSPITSLAPGQRALIVRDLAAFTAVHGAGKPVAGVFANATALSNGGEAIKLDDPLNNTVKDFIYNNKVPWPSADGTGASLVLIRPDTNPDPSLASNWRASNAIGGNPGGEDASHFTGNPNADDDSDGLTKLMEYALGTSDATPGSPNFEPTSGSLAGVPFLEITTTRPNNADDGKFVIEASADLTSWATTGVTLRSTMPVAGTVTEVWRLSPAPPASRSYLRSRVTLR